MTFSSLSEYYAYIEADKTILYNFNISSALISLRDGMSGDDEKRICSFELFFNDFSFIDGKANGKLKYFNGDQYPNFSLFDDNLAYIITQAEAIQNPKYKAKYNHLLWESPAKNIKYARAAVDNYFSFIESFTYPLPDNLSNHVFENTYKNLIILCQTVNYKKEDALQYLLSVLGSGKINGYKEYALIRFIVENGSKISTPIIQACFDYVLKVTDTIVYPDLTKEFLELLILISPKVKQTSKIYQNRLAECYVAEASLATENFLMHDLYFKSLSHFKKAGNKERIEAITVLMEDVKKKLEFKLLKIEHKDDLLQKWFNEKVKLVNTLVNDYLPKDIYEYIILSESILPKAAILDEEVRPVSFDFIHVQNFDINKNISGKQKSGINPYYLQIRNFGLRELWLIFSKGFKAGKINYESLISFLKEYTWYGQNFTNRNNEGQLDGFDWIALLSPALFSFFNQSQIDLSTNSNNDVGYILAIDSMVIKFEGLLREFSRQIGAQTIEVKENETSERISFDKLLENEKLLAVIPEDDIAYLKFLFTSAGMNLRNNIAHSFYKANDYSAGTMFLLITALLRLGNYELKTITNDVLN
jgi:hypothetical protein